MSTPQERSQQIAAELSPKGITNAIVILSAREEALSRNHSLIGGEHLLLALIQMPAIKDLFSKLGYDPDFINSQINSAVDFIAGKRVERPTAQYPRLSPRSKTIFELADRIASSQNRKEVTEEDLLRGILLEHEGVGAGILETLGFTLDIKLVKRNQ